MEYIMQQIKDIQLGMTLQKQYLKNKTFNVK